MSNEKSSARSGMIFASDLITAIIIFLIAFAAIYVTWNSILDSSMDVDAKDMELSAIRASDNLVKSAGYPDNWETSPGNATVIGLAKWNRRIDSGKLNAFLNMDYEASKEKIGVIGYEYSFSMNRSGVVKSGPAGGVGKDVVSVKRVVDYNGEDILELDLWKE